MSQTHGSPMQQLTPAGWGVIGASGVTLVASVLPWYSVDLDGFGSASVNGWHRFWVIGILLAVAIGVVYGLQAFKVIPPQPQLQLFYAYGSIAAFVLTFLSLIDTFTHGDSGPGYSFGPSFGVFLALLSTAALAYFATLAAQESGAKLPIKVPGLPTR